MQKIKTLLVDDEPSALEGLAIRLESFDEIQITDQVGSVQAAIQSINTNPPELIFLDIEMPKQNGFDLVAQLQGDQMPAIVFVTAYHQHAVKAFEVRAIDYLLKPVKLDRLAETIIRIKQQTAKQKSEIISVFKQIDDKSNTAAKMSAQADQQKLMIEDGANPIHMVPFADIEWIDAAGDYMCVHSNEKTHIMRARLKSLIDQLPDYFMRIHKSTIVNLNLIKQLTPLRNCEYMLELQNGKQLKVSRTYGKSLKNRLAQI
ncbi:LytR/AlgR family response regulator transcription factor [Gayadomonas joobiniege]|uniref:LytR/AlgR family response regulator transcription factor n=1 Tax=Gayadomonas joobiniege TaxID=1234606 RepID=UPI000369B497|nr:LytTR family DNA-binding domain-containing protein [Gayadomonas joobiniege]